jgi:hypothetical protein
MFASAIAVSTAMAIGALVPVHQIHVHRWGEALRLTVVIAWFTAAYIPLVRWIAPEAWGALLQRLAGLYRGRAADAEAVAAAAVSAA